MRTFREYLKSIPQAMLEKYSQRELEVMQEGWSAALESVLGDRGEKKDTRNARIPEWIGRGK